MKQNRGFSLVEMSIVLVIIALLLGGVMVGKNMVRSAQIEATFSKAESYNAAIVKFRDRFYSLPGDMPNATTQWGSVNATAACTAPVTTTDGDNIAVGTGTQTCNGNGDGKIGGTAITTGVLGGCKGNLWEVFRLWQHLANSGLIEGHFSGTTSGGADVTVIGTNIPATALNGGGYTVLYCGAITAATWYYFTGNYGNFMEIGSVLGASPYAFSQRALFTPQEAGAIDKKLDDTFPHTGRIVANRSDDTRAPNCTNSALATPASADYDYTYKDAKCPLFMKLGI